MGFFRSNKVLHLKIRMPSDIDGLMRIMDLFGKTEIEALEFIDLMKDELDSKKSFTAMLKRVEQMEIKTNQFFNFANEFQQKIYKYTSYEKFIDDLETDISLKELSLSSYFDYIESEINDNERKILDLKESYQKMKEDLLHSSSKFLPSLTNY